MKIIFETETELEAKQLLAAKDCLSALHTITEYLIKCDDIDEKIKDDLFDIINEIDLDILWD